jgi:hypothetical protein
VAASSAEESVRGDERGGVPRISGPDPETSRTRTHDQGRHLW